MKFLLFLNLILLVGCSSFPSQNNFTLTSGRYILEVQWYNQKAYKADILIENNDGRLEIISPLDGAMICGGILDGNNFLLSFSTGNTYMIYRGDLTANNKVKGELKGRVQADPHRAYPVDIEKKDTAIKKGIFNLYPYTFKRSSSVTDFLMTVDAPPYFLAKRYDPRTYRFLIGRHGQISAFKNMRYNVSGNILASFDKTLLSEEQFKEKLQHEFNIYGIDIPIHIYPQRDTTISSMNKVLRVCGNFQVSRFFIVTLHPKWGGLLTFPFDLFDDSVRKNHPDKDLFHVKIAKNGYLVNNKKIGDINSLLRLIEEQGNSRSILLSYTGDAKIDSLIKLLISCYKNRQKRVYLQVNQ